MTAPIDLRSDTATRPTAGMREAIFQAEVGDDMLGEDPTVNALEQRICELLGVEAAVYGCSGTQSNQMAVRAHCHSGDELLIEESSHIANFEAGGPAVLSGVTCRTLQGRSGLLDVDDLNGKIRGDNQHMPPTRLLCLENTTNLGGGRTYSLEHIERVTGWAHNHGLKVHMDGARFFNAIVKRDYDPREVCQHLDSLSICFSKGLGCPMGSILAGSREFIARTRRARKLFGGALRQTGMMAASALYALEHHIDRLAEDHENARLLAEGLAEIEGLKIDLSGVETNLVFFDVLPEVGYASQLCSVLKSRGVLIGALGTYRLRACTHLDISREDVLTALEVIKTCLETEREQIAIGATGPALKG